MSTEPVRIIYDNSNQTGFPEHHGKVFAVIGPFDGHLDKVDLQKAIERVLVEHNSAIGHGPGEEVEIHGRKGYRKGPNFPAPFNPSEDGDSCVTFL